MRMLLFYSILLPHCAQYAPPVRRSLPQCGHLLLSGLPMAQARMTARQTTPI